MGFELTGKKVSLTYNNLIQCISDNYYDGLGNLINITDASYLNVILSNYISDASLGEDFYWDPSDNKLNVISIGNNKIGIEYIDGSLSNIRAIYIPDSSLNPTQFIWNNGILDVSVIDSSGVSQAYVDGSINNIRATYIPDASLSSDFYWNISNLLRVDVSIAGSVVNPDLDYITYMPRVSDVSFYYTGDNVIQILSISDIGIKDVSFVYDLNGDVSIISINNYGLWTRQVTFEKDIDENVIAVHVT